MGPLAGSAPRARPPPQIAAQERDELFRDDGEDLMQSRRAGVSGHACRYELADGGFELPRRVLREHLAQLGDDRVLPREVLVERCDVDAGTRGDSIRRQFRRSRATAPAAAFFWAKVLTLCP